MDTLWMFGQKDGFGWTARQMEYHAIQNSLKCSSPSMSRHPWEWRWRVVPEGLSGGFRTGKKTCTL